MGFCQLSYPQESRILKLLFKIYFSLMPHHPYQSSSWKSSSNTPHKRNRTGHFFSRPFIKNFLLLGVAIVIAGSLGLMILIAVMSGSLPNPNSLTQRSISQTTKIFDRSGEHLLYEIFGDENRTLKKIQEGFCKDDKNLETDANGIPLYALQATIAAEDRSFCKHNGFDVKGFARAIFQNLIGNRVGGSTLTQQLVKNAILSNEKTVTRKLKELLLSIELERRYSKDEILQIYFNEIPYGSTYYGIEAASQNFFGKTAHDLTLAQAATLAALPKAPTTYLNNPDRLVVRRDYILDEMKDLGFISQDQWKSAISEESPLQVQLDNISAPHFVMYVKEALDTKYGERAVAESGMKVITTLNFDQQKIAEEEVKKGVDDRGVALGFTNAALVAIDPKTGQITSMVGSKDFFDTEIDGQVNVSTRLRQPGSSFKPIVYSKAFEMGYTPSTVVWDVVTNFPTSTGTYTPHNYDLKERGLIRLRDALQLSLNIPAVKMVYLVGVETALDFATSLGYTGFADHSAFGMSVVLGGGEVKLLEHTNAYATFANEGTHFDSVAILRIEDTDGNVLEEWKPKSGKRVIEANAARTITSVLSDNAARSPVFGPNSSLQLGDRPVAAKSGTTNDHRDGWLMGYTPSLAVGVWAGNNDNAVMKKNAGGESAAGPIWNSFLKRVLLNTPIEFFTPAIIEKTGKTILDGGIAGTTLIIDKASGKIATQYTPESQKEERLFAEYHSLLHYVDRTDPRGPVPSDPSKDPQYNAWESAIGEWIKKKEAETGKIISQSVPPTEYDDMHTPENFPSVKILTPNEGQSTGRSVSLSVSATAPRPIQRVEFYVDGLFIGSDDSAPYSFEGLLPNSVDRGQHTIKTIAYDTIDNQGSATVGFQVNEDPSDESLTLIDPKNGQIIERSNDTYTVVVSLKHPEQYAWIRVVSDPIGSGAKQLVGQQNNPNAVFLTFDWDLPPHGSFALIAEGSTKSGQLIKTAGVIVTIKPKSSSVPSPAESTLNLF